MKKSLKHILHLVKNFLKDIVLHVRRKLGFLRKKLREPPVQSAIVNLLTNLVAALIAGLLLK